MSIFFDFHVPSHGFRFRRAVDQDRLDIEAFIDPEEKCKLFFDQVDIGILIELCTLAIVMIDSQQAVVGFMALCDHPDVPGVPPDWEDWLTNMFHQIYLPRHTLFIRFMCCSARVERIFLEQAMIAVYNNDAYLNQVGLVIPPRCPYSLVSRYTSCKTRSYMKYWSYDEYHEKQLCLLLAQRKFFCPKLKVRRAVEEDTEDIVAILDAKCPELRELYGNYYTSEIIANDPDRTILVAQHQDQAVGVMCLTTKVDCANLQLLYELNALHGLVKASPFEKEVYKRQNAMLSEFGDPIALGEFSPYHVFAKKMDGPGRSTQSMSRSNSNKSVCREGNTGANRVNFRRRLSHRPIPVYRPSMASEDYSEILATSHTSQVFETSVTNLLDEDPFDYEIVNIDKNLLAMAYSPYDNLNFAEMTDNQPSEKNKYKERTSVRMHTIIDKPEYEGPPNAFAIELYGLRPDIDERKCFDLLQASFDCMQQYEYCVILVPTGDKSFHLLQHFTYIPTKPNTESKFALYVAHRNSVNDRIKVRQAELRDVPKIAQLLKDLDVMDTMRTVEQCVTGAKEEKAFVITSGSHVVGLAVVETPKHKDMAHLTNLRARFNIDTFMCPQYYDSCRAVNSGVSVIKSVFIYQVYDPHYRFFARELMRLSGSAGLVWMTGYRSKQLGHKVNAMVSSMIPVLPRKQAVFRDTPTRSRKARNNASYQMPFCLWILGKKHTSLPRVCLNTRIVIVGASRTAMSFLNTLLFRDSSTYLTFMSVTLVSPSGLPYLRRRHAPAEMMFRKFRTNTDLFFKSTPYRHYLNIVHGTMVEINKQQKYIGLEKGTRVYYDLLFLTIGKQFLHPMHTSCFRETDEPDSNKYVRMDVPRHTDFEPPLIYYDTPDNVFIINSILEAAKALKSLRHIEWWTISSRVIVYGCGIEVYCCISALLELGVPARHIVFVEAFPAEDDTKPRVTPFCNHYVDEAVTNVINKLQISVYRAFHFRSWTAVHSVATQVHFISYFEALTLDCHAFFYYGKRGLSPSAFGAIHKCGLAYNGGILIDHKFRTQVASIYAAGPATNYFAKYFAEYRRQEFFDSRDCGKLLGSQILDKLDPCLKVLEHANTRAHGGVRRFLGQAHGDAPPADGALMVRADSDGGSSVCPEWWLPDLRKPKVCHCILPGNLQYLEVRPPGYKMPHPYVQLSLNYNGVIMETFKTGYFKLHMTNDMVVDGITCLTARRHSLDCLPKLYGQSAITLNNVHLRYSLKRMDDFFEFFNAPWATFLNHELAHELMATVKEVMPAGEPKGNTIKEALRLVAENMDNIPDDGNTYDSNKEKIQSNFSKSPHFAAITEHVMEWLAENDELMPGFLQRRHVVDYSYDLSLHPAFKKSKYHVTQVLKQMNK